MGELPEEEHVPAVERRLHNGRGVTSVTDPDAPDGGVVGWPEQAYEAIRALNHLTFGVAIPAPVAYDVLGNLKGVGNMLPQLLGQLAAGMQRSLAQYVVYDNRAEDPAVSVEDAAQHLHDAALAAQQLGASLEAAQRAISAQGHRGPRDGDVITGPWTSDEEQQ
jgi:hypothetical protein